MHIASKARLRVTVSAILLSTTMAMAMVGCTSTSIKEVISTTDAPTVIGPYSQAIRSGSTLYLSGQIAIDPKTNQMNLGTIEEQTKQVLENLRAVLKANGMTMDHVVSTNVYLKDLNDFGKMNTVYGGFFKNPHPARTTVQVARLPRDALLEIAAIASK